ncbi:MAG: isoamylase, partial [Chlamydiota bacterium]
MNDCKITQGLPKPLGVTQDARGGCNFALFSEHAENVTLCLFSPKEKFPFLEAPMKKTENIWHLHINKVPFPCEYAYRIKDHYLLDPYAKEIESSHLWDAAKDEYFPKGILSQPVIFSWKGEKKPNIPFENLIIYEMHVRAFTKDPSSKVSHPGTFLGVIEKLPYLKELGINAVELMPLCEFNESEYDKEDPTTHTPLYNFWGYSTINFFSPMNRYAEEKTIQEFKTMVLELHKHGIEVILDMVYNHTGEHGLSFRGIDDKVYYMHNKEGNPIDFTGTGNTFNCNHPAVIPFILDSLRYWVTEMHIDGFRFDLASIFTRNSEGMPLEDPPLLKAMNEDPIISKVKLIAESWDAGGLYQVGLFPKFGPWSEWNGKFRDVVRKFIKGTDGFTPSFATALCGSQDLYGHYDSPIHSINFVTAHDGFTLHDLVSYQEKHNLRNAEDNRDGINDNESWNCGEEGPTKNRKTLQVRQKQVRNFQMALFLSLGVPMIVMGDEHLHTKDGNNNTWCHDNELNWIKWNTSSHNDFFRFTRLLIKLRRHHPIFERQQFLTNEDIDWHGHTPFEPDWSLKSRFIAYTLKDHTDTFYIAFNANYEPAHIYLPAVPHKHWHRMIDTSLPPPEDFIEHPHEEPPLKTTYTLPPYSALLLKAH